MQCGENFIKYTQTTPEKQNTECIEALLVWGFRPVFLVRNVHHAAPPGIPHRNEGGRPPPAYSQTNVVIDVKKISVKKISLDIGHDRYYI